MINLTRILAWYKRNSGRSKIFARSR